MSKHKHEQGASSAAMNQAQEQTKEQTQNQSGPALVPEVEVQPGAEGPQGNQAGAVNTPEAQLAAARAEIDLLKAQVSELNDKYLRTLAEQVNFRKRVVKEKEEFQQYAISTLLADLIPVLDDFDRSLETVVQHKTDAEKVAEGIQLIQKKLYDTLSSKYGLTKYESKNSVFDPHMHEAMFSDEGNVAMPTVTQEFMPGYKLHERIIRTAKVKVTMPSSGNASAPSTQGTSVSESANGESPQQG